MQAGIYKHYKGGLYQVLGVGEHTETGEKMVVYVSLAFLPGCRLRIRPEKMFNEFVVWPSDGIYRTRFQYVGDEI